MPKLACSLLLFFYAVVAQGQPIREIRIWMNAFIPRRIPVVGGQDLTFTINAGRFAGKTTIEGPFNRIPLVKRFYLTDNRDFSTDLSAKARAHSEVIIDVSNSAINKGPLRNDSTYSFTSLQGDLICGDIADPSTIKVVDQKVTIGPNENKIFEFTFDGSAQNPCFQVSVPNPDPEVPPEGSVNLSPSIDWFVNVKVEMICGELARITATGRIEKFPAFEMYASVNGFVKPVFQISPVNAATPFDLFGPASRLLTDLLNPPNPVLVGNSVQGSWQSNDPNKRFSLRILESEVEWTEKFPETGITLMRKVPLAIKDGEFRIERSNTDIEVLRMLGYSPEIITAIVQAGPRPSFLSFCIKNGRIEAKWSGLIVKKTAQGKFDKLVQPGDSPSKIFSFDKQ